LAIFGLDRKKVSDVQKKENSIKNKTQYRTKKDEPSSSESNRDKSTDRRVIFLIFMKKYVYLPIFVMTTD